jgi:HlyD family secretion protein
VERLDDVLLVPNAALRFTPPAKAAAARPSGGLVGMLLPRPPRENKRPTAAGAAEQEAWVWVLHDAEPQAVRIKIGASDGVSTHMLEGSLKAGTALLIDTIARGRQQ